MFSNDLSYETFLEQIKKNPNCLEDPVFQEKFENSNLSKEQKEELSLIGAVTQNVARITSIPETKLTPEICLAAVKQTPEAMALVPETMRNYKMMFECVSHQDVSQRGYISMTAIPREMRILEMCAVLIKQYPAAIKDIIDFEESTKLTLKEYEQIWDIALDGDPLLIQFLPRSLQNRERFAKAIVKNLHVLNFLPNDIILDQSTRELAFQKALERDWEAIHLVPWEERTEDFYRIALELISYGEDRASSSINTLVHQFVKKNNMSELLETMAELLLAENNRLKDAFLNIFFDYSDNEQRIDAENKEKLRLIKIWETNLKKILFPLLEENKGKQQYWEFVEILLKKFSEAYPNKKLEVLMPEVELTYLLDLTQVIEMLLTNDSEKNKSLLILPSFLIDQLSLSASNSSIVCKTKIDKLSFLDSWSLGGKAENTELLFSRVNKMTNIIKKIPPDMVVLRGCSTTGLIEDPALFSPKKIKIVSPTKTLENETLNKDVFLFQQWIEYAKDNKEMPIVRTRVRYYNHHNQLIDKQIDGISPNESNLKLSPKVEKELALLSKKNDLPLLFFQSKEMDKLLKRIREDWLKNKSVPKEEKKILKAAEKRTKTYLTTAFPSQKSLASALDEKLTKEGIKVPIKSYAGPYRGYKSGAMINPDHGHHMLPKALKTSK